MPETDDPTAIRSIAVSAEDVVTAYERTLRSGSEAVLRVTPPFSARMRARIHVPIEGEDADGAGAPIHVDPESLVADPPSYPEPDETEAALRADPDETYTRERHRERHQAAVEEWREVVGESIVDRVRLPIGDDRRHEVAVKRLE